jgi:DMSO/TMAO reductase YedYZ molybdopterin-dependent catalytic subunit
MNRDKLIETKIRWAAEGRLLVPQPAGRGRLPPGQTLVHDWPVLDLGTQPNLARRDWRLTVGGLVARPIDWGWDEFARLRASRSVSDIHCVTQWSRYDNAWAGIAGRDLVAHLEPLPTARFVRVRSFDGYGTTVALDDFVAEGALLATHWAGAPLTRAHGGPVRLMIPQLYFWKSAKWVRHLWFTDRDAPGYWEARGYHPRGDPWRQERYR